MPVTEPALEALLCDMRLVMHFKRLPINVAINFVFYHMAIALTVPKMLGIIFLFLLTSGIQKLF